jgi:hypothetical protein
MSAQITRRELGLGQLAHKIRRLPRLVPFRAGQTEDLLHDSR